MTTLNLTLNSCVTECHFHLCSPQLLLGTYGRGRRKRDPYLFLRLFGTLCWTSVGSLNLGREVCANPEVKTKFPPLWIYCHLRRYHADTFSIKKMLKNSSYTYDQTNWKLLLLSSKMGSVLIFGIS